MADIESLVNRILKDGADRAEAVRLKAKEEADGILAGVVSAMKAEEDKALEDAGKEAASLGERIIENQKQQSRNMVLTVKQKAVDAVYGKALSYLNGLSKKEFETYVKETVASLSADGDEIILPKKYGYSNVSWLNDYLKKQGQPGNVTLHTGDRDIAGGFILAKGGIERNYTFDALLEFYRYDTEGAVLDSLFGKGAGA